MLTLLAPTLGRAQFAPGPGTTAGANTASAPGRIADELQWLKAEKIMVTSVSKRAEDAFGAAAAVSVITSDELRRTGVRTLADALRLVPGMQVANINSNVWSISTRGFNDQYSTKLLVLNDGRAMYSPAIMGIYWNLQNSLFEDIARIEVVRGPGGTLWGANAVNGVVNVITKTSQDTQGTFLDVAGGDEKSFVALRHGDKLGQRDTYRVYAKFDHFNDSASSGLAPVLAPRPSLGAAHDAWSHFMTGFRTDFELPEDKLSLHGDYFGARITGQTFVPSLRTFSNVIQDEDFTAQGLNLVSKWTHLLPNDTEWQLQAYYDYLERPSHQFNYRFHVVDIDFQHRLRIAGQHEVTYGTNLRRYSDETKNVDPKLLINPARQTMDSFSVFLQDDITLAKDLHLIAGSKFERNYFSGWEYQPSARIVWTPTENNTLWGSVSRAVRTPSRIERGIDISVLTPQLGVFPHGYGNPAFDSEKLIAYELGYRTRPMDRVTFDFTGFYFRYADLYNPVPYPDRIRFPFGPPAPAIVPIEQLNNGAVDSYGLEFAYEFRAQEWWRLHGGYTLFDTRKAVNQATRPNATPRHQYFFRSTMDAHRGVSLDLWLRWTGDVPTRALDAFWDLDARLAWKPSARWEWALVGQNLLRAQRRQFAPPDLTLATVVTEIQRSVYLQVSIRL